MKSVWCENVLFAASLPKLCGDKQWIICSVADLIIHSDDLIISIRQICVSQNSLHHQIGLTTMLVYKDAVTTQQWIISHLTLVTRCSYTPLFIYEWAAGRACSLSPLISHESSVLTFVALSLFGHCCFAGKEDQSAELQSGLIGSFSFYHTGLRSSVK